MCGGAGNWWGGRAQLRPISYSGHSTVCGVGATGRSSRCSARERSFRKQTICDRCSNERALLRRNVPTLPSPLGLPAGGEGRKHHGEGRAAVQLARDGDCTLVLLDDAAGDGKSEPGAVGFGGEERIEQLAQVLGS